MKLWLALLALRAFRGIRFTCVVASAVFLGALTFTERVGSRELTLMLPVVAIVLVSYLAERIVQARLNRGASSLLSEDRSQTLILYLRSFDRSMLGLHVRRVVQFVVEAINFVIPVTPAVDHLSPDVERHVADVASLTEAVLVAIGDKYFTVGATKVRTHDRNWQTLFEALANRCRIIVCEVHSSPSCIWEIQRIAASTTLLAKTAFVLPPAHILIDYEKVVATARNAGLDLPAYNLDGWIYVASPEPQLHGFRQLDDVIVNLLSAPAA